MQNSPQDGRRVALNLVGNFAGTLGGIIGVGSVAAILHWVSVAPRVPDPSRGEVFVFNNHGSILYFTAYQHFVELAAVPIGVLLVFLALGILPKRNVVYRRGFLFVSMRFDPDDPEAVGVWGRRAGLVAGLAIIAVLDPMLLRWLVSQVRALLSGLH